MTGRDRLWCVVPAAGRGQRFGGELPKQYVELAGKPLLMWTLERLASLAEIAGLVVVIAADDRWWPDPRSLAGKPVRTVTGGGERADSVRAGLHVLAADVPDDAFVLVHDAVRPCVRGEDVARLVELGIAAGGGLLAAPLRDTLKRADADGRVAATEPRDRRWRALTPQMFRRGALDGALADAKAKGIEITDEAMAMELVGHRPLLIQGCEDNIKVTTRADMAFAAYMLGVGNRE
jgi:2-C-methyl-D-erythritol 4-phosphate cytidylyltransferase